MKIVVAHNFYGSAAPSGENNVVRAEVDLLKSRGHDVRTFYRHSDEIRSLGSIGMALGAMCTPWNPLSRHKLRAILKEVRPDVLHVHNTFPLLSPSVFSAASGLPVAVVMTVHNYRLFCTNGLAMREQKPCIDCLSKGETFHSLKFGCYRESRLATLPVATMISLNRALGTWESHVDAFIALSRFQTHLLVRYGLQSDAIHIKPNFLDSSRTPLAWLERDHKAVFIGRLSAEKGVHTLLNAWWRWGPRAPRLSIIGDGPIKAALEARAADLDLLDRVQFLGQLSFEEVQEQLSTSKLMIIPSLFFEGFPMIIREAYSLGVPVVASRIGSLEDIVEHGAHGFLFEPGNAEELVRTLQLTWQSEDALEYFSRNVRAKYLDEYTSSSGYQKLMSIYDAAVAHRAGRPGVAA